MTEPVLIVTNYPDSTNATALAEELIKQHLAACVNVSSAGRSIYRWQGKIESAEEFQVWIKTRKQHHDRVEQLIKMMHPYELPEIIMVPIIGGSTAYLQWINDETNTI
ncbi:MAG: divalent-cation tolerance protein CutA [Nitrosomonas sp.]|nr:divalent-cation tolerance protein CutA [Nitrosomonas sp.]